MDLPARRTTSLPARVRKTFVSSFLDALKPSTMESYRKDLRYFAQFAGSDDVDQAAEALLSHGRGFANEIVRNYSAHMLNDLELAPATVNRRLSALRAMVNVAEEQGLVDWTIKVRGVKSKPYRDTKGPGVEAVRAMLLEIQNRTSDRARVRDTAIIRCLFDLGLRSNELVQINLSDLDLEGDRVWVLGKGYLRERVAISLPPQTLEALRAWVELRGRGRGPLFTTNCAKIEDGGTRISGHALYQLVRRLGVKVGVRARPHGIRHSAITAALQAGAKVEDAQLFGRHADVRTTMIYRDALDDAAGGVAQTVADLLDGEKPPKA